MDIKNEILKALSSTKTVEDSAVEIERIMKKWGISSEKMKEMILKLEMKSLIEHQANRKTMANHKKVAQIMKKIEKYNE